MSTGLLRAKKGRLLLLEGVTRARFRLNSRFKELLLSDRGQESWNHGRCLHAMQLLLLLLLDLFFLTGLLLLRYCWHQKLLLIVERAALGGL